jgi:hypothetical protein
MEPRDDPRAEGVFGCGGGSLAPVVGVTAWILGDFGDLSEPHLEGLKDGDTSWASEKVLFCSFLVGADDRPFDPFPNILGSDFASVGLLVARMLTVWNVVSIGVRATGIEARRGEEDSWARADGRILSGATLKTSSSLEEMEGVMGFSTNFW